MYYLPIGTRCKAAWHGKPLLDHVTRKALLFQECSVCTGGLLVFEYGGYVIAVEREAIQQRTFHRREPRLIGDILKESELLK